MNCNMTDHEVVVLFCLFDCLEAVSQDLHWIRGELEFSLKSPLPDLHTHLTLVNYTAAAAAAAAFPSSTRRTHSSLSRMCQFVMANAFWTAG